jgi:hypothetical protein
MAGDAFAVLKYTAASIFKTAINDWGRWGKNAYTPLKSISD